jgi:hypothetical protein
MAGRAHPALTRELRGFPAMIDMDVARFDVRAVSRSEERQHLSYARNMLIATAAASLSIVGAGAFFISLWL